MAGQHLFAVLLLLCSCMRNVGGGGAGRGEVNSVMASPFFSSSPASETNVALSTVIILRLSMTMTVTMTIMIDDDDDDDNDNGIEDDE